MWTHLIRRRDSDYPVGAFATPFSASLNEKYRERMASEQLFRNDLYLTVLWSPARDHADKAGKLLSRLRRSKRLDTELDEEALKQLKDKVANLMAGLRRFEPRILSLYEEEDMLFSEPS